MEKVHLARKFSNMFNFTDYLAASNDTDEFEKSVDV